MTAKRKSQFNTKDLIIALGVLPLIVFLYLVAYFAAFAITVMAGGVNVLDSETAIVNEGVFNFIRYALSLVVLGWIYYRGFYNYDRADEKEVDDRKESVKNSLSYSLQPLSLLALLLAGFTIQLGTDSVLYILGTLYPTTFASYQHMMETFTGSLSPLFIITSITLGPIVEELAFRGLIIRHLQRLTTPDNKKAQIAICAFQALLFAVYHVNLVQMCYAFIFGMLFGFLAIRFKSLLPSILLHMIVNGSLYVIPEAFLANIYHAALLGAISLLLLVASILIFVLRASEKPSESSRQHTPS